MKRTVSLKLTLSDYESLSQMMHSFSKVCNAIVPFARENRCWNTVSLHHLCYYKIREKFPEIGSQMVCNAIRKVCASYKVLKIKKSEEVPLIVFKTTSSVHYCARTFSLKENALSLFTLNGRIKCSYKIGAHQERYLAQGKAKEGELIKKGNRWFFNLVLDIPEVMPIEEGIITAVDVGENNLATTSHGTIYGGGKLRAKRDKFLARRRKLQSNGSKSAKRRLKRISGREKRHVKEVNHMISKKIVEEAVKMGTKTLVMEKLTHIRKRIKGGKRLRSRLHRWAWWEFQQFVEYKAQSKGISVVYVNPAYTSLTCSLCGSLGSRHKHQFKCSCCGSYQHSDRNACQNLCRLARSAVLATAPVNRADGSNGLPLVTSFSL